HAYAHLVVEPYPEKYIREVTLPGGLEVILRPIRPEDEPLERAFLSEGSSRESLYFRFFGQVPNIDHSFLTRFTQFDYSREMAIAALVADGKGSYHMVGVVRIVGELLQQAAEYAIIVADEIQGQGLGTVMTQYIMDIARDMGLRTLHASVLATNKPMIGLFKKLGFKLEREDFETYRVEMEL
ncbi:MAG: GNAT family N-acetyltransferase, partial [Lewinella sp.]|nr:GNAT family N-acetyltransferase [Lewinella sp.]